MANQLKAVVTADIRQFVSAMRMVSASSATAAGASVAAFTAVIAVVTAMDKAAINAAKSYESLALALRFAIGDASKASSEFEKLAVLSDRTPFDQTELVKWSIQLRNVTGNLVGTSAQIELMAGALTKAKQSGVGAQSFVNSLGRVISGFQLGGVGLKRFIRTLQKTGAVLPETSKALLELARQGGGAHQAIAILEKDFLKSQGAALLASQTAEGLESTLKSVFTRTLAQLGTQGLMEYKEILVDIIQKLIKIRDTDAFKGLGESIGALNSTLNDIAGSGSLETIVKGLTLITNALNAILTAGRLINELTLGPRDLITAYKTATSDDKAGAIKGRFSNSVIGGAVSGIGEMLSGSAIVAKGVGGSITREQTAENKKLLMIQQENAKSNKQTSTAFEAN